MAERALFAAYSCITRHMWPGCCYAARMALPDLNLLVALDVLLTEGSVARAARRLRLSPSAMSRTLARLREATGDALLVRAGRGLVPTPRALVLRAQVGTLVEEAAAMLRPEVALHLAGLVRNFTLRTSEGFVENVGPALLDRIAREAPGVRMHFVTKSDKDNASLREGSADFETGVIGQATSPEIRAQALFQDRLIGAVRPGHPLSAGELTPARYAAGRHILVSRRGSEEGPVDTVLAALGLRREIATIVSGFAAALALARSSDLIATVPEHHTRSLRAGLHSFALPFPIGDFTVCLLWLPWLDGDAAHRWLRGCIRDVCASWR